MYLHLGQGVVVPHRDIVGVFDLDNTSSSRLTRAFLEGAERAGRVVNASGDLPKSFVLCRPEGGEATVKSYYPLSRGRLELRPANPEYNVQIYSAEEVSIQGRVVELRRKY